MTEVVDGSGRVARFDHADLRKLSTLTHRALWFALSSERTMDFVRTQGWLPSFYSSTPVFGARYVVRADAVIWAYGQRIAELDTDDLFYPLMLLDRTGVITDLDENVAKHLEAMGFIARWHTTGIWTPQWRMTRTGRESITRYEEAL